MKLEIKNLYAKVKEKVILKGITLTIETGKVYALMGPNGSGKSTLSQVLMGHPKYIITKGEILLDGKDITNLSPDKRAKLGLFLSFQYPTEITGVTLTNFLRASYNSIHEKKLSVVEFYNLLKEKMKTLDIDTKFSRRYINTGFSGGEKKKAEILQLSVLNPKFAILDETDSGLDVDALKVVSKGINKYKSNKNCILLITHYYRILKYIKPNTVFIMKNGKIIKTGDSKLAKQIEETGFK